MSEARVFRSSGDFHPRRDSNLYHVGIIPDGCRRWAKRNGVTIDEGYNEAMSVLIDIIECLYEESIPYVSLYLSSIQNFRRSKPEITAFCSAEESLCRYRIPSLAAKYGTRVTAVGCLDILPRTFQDALSILCQETEEYSRTRLYLCFAYDPFLELKEALSTTKDPADVYQSLGVPEPLDIIIRTGGANLLSNFLPLQSGFARLYFLDLLFNDLSRSEIMSVLEHARSLKRRYGE